jgi:hypothetical protein
MEKAYARSRPDLNVDRLWSSIDPDRLIPMLPDHYRGEEAAIRSYLVYSAGRTVENRFLLATLAIRAIRALHLDSTRTQDTANRVFSDISQGRYAPAPPLTDPLLITPAA